MQKAQKPCHAHSLLGFPPAHPKPSKRPRITGQVVRYLNRIIIDITTVKQYCMQDEEFEWDDAKAALNWRDHGVSFEMARDVFKDIFAIEWTDDRHGDAEERFVTVGMVEGRLLLVVYTLRGERIRIISARRPSRANDGDTTMKTKHDWSRLDAMTEEQRRAAALADPDAQPLSDADMDRMKPTPRLKIIRRALGLTQEEFAARYQIPLGTLRDWEQGAKQPDQAAAPISARSPATRPACNVRCMRPYGSRGENAAAFARSTSIAIEIGRSICRWEGERRNA